MKAAVLQGDDVETGSAGFGPKHQARNSHGLLCRNRCVAGTVQRCLMDASGKIVRETKVASEPAALSRYFAEFEPPIVRTISKRNHYRQRSVG